MDTAAKVWKAIGDMFPLQSKSRIVTIRTQLVGMQKGDMIATTYFTKIKSLFDEMASNGKKLEDDDIMSYVLGGLNSD